MKLDQLDIKILEFICKGFTCEEIADRIERSAAMVKSRRCRMIRKHNFTNFNQVVYMAAKMEII